MEADDGLPVLAFASAGEWEAWLEANHSSSRGLWVRFAKKGSAVASVSNDEALDVALCFGWIDGLRRSVDDDFYLERHTPRRARSTWSQVNVEKAERMIAEGRMRPSGLAEVERAKADGRWDAAYPRPSEMTVPDDLRRELAASPRAIKAYEGLGSAERYAILYGLTHAKRPETRARRLESFVAKLEAGERIS